MPTFHRRAAILSAAAAALVGLSSCSSSTADPAAAEAVDSASSTASSTSEVPAVSMNQELHDALPEDIKVRGELTGAVVSWAPHSYYETDGVTGQGTTFDVAAAMSDLLGIEVTTQIVPAFSNIVTGLNSDRYDMGLGPVGDTAAMRESFDFVDWVQEWVVFAVQPGNPTGITSTENTCGKKIAVLAAGGAEKVIKEQDTACQAGGQEAINVQSYEDGNAAILAVRSGRADAYFASQANLQYFIAQSPDELELAGQGAPNGFGDMRQGTFFTKDQTQLRDVWLDAMNELQAQGVISAIMANNNVADNELDEFGINVGV